MTGRHGPSLYLCLAPLAGFT